MPGVHGTAVSTLRGSLKAKELDQPTLSHWYFAQTGSSGASKGNESYSLHHKIPYCVFISTFPNAHYTFLLLLGCDHLSKSNGLWWNAYSHPYVFIEHLLYARHVLSLFHTSGTRDQPVKTELRGEWERNVKISGNFGLWLIPHTVHES